MAINRTSLARLGFESWRDFYTNFGLWLYGHDFTYQEAEDWSQSKLISEFLLDTETVPTRKLADEWSKLIV
jgi:hypothetical protein